MNRILRLTMESKNTHNDVQTTATTIQTQLSKSQATLKINFKPQTKTKTKTNEIVVFQLQFLFPFHFDTSNSKLSKKVRLKSTICESRYEINLCVLDLVCKTHNRERLFRSLLIFFTFESSLCSNPNDG